MNNKNKILALFLVVLVMVLGAASLYISTRLNQQGVTPTAPGSQPQAAGCEEKCPAPNGELWNCHPTESDGSAQKSVCNTAGRVESCGGVSYCCPAPGGKWTTDMTACGGAATTWVGSTACKVTGTVACTPTAVITCNPDCPTACGLAASVITTCKDSCNNAKTKQCPATAACGTPDLTIVKKAFWNETTNTAGNYTLTTEISAVSKDQIFVYAIYIENVSTVTATNVRVHDTLDGQKQDLLTFVDAQSGCNYDTGTRTISCAGLTLAAGAKGTYAFRVKVTGNAVNGDVIKNTGKVTYGTVTKEAYKDLIVSTIVSCNNTCTTDAECSGGLVCDATEKMCRASACLTMTNCNCPTTTPTPTLTTTPTTTTTPTATTTVSPTIEVGEGTPQPTVLPEAGILDIPGVAAFGGGLLLAVIGIMLAL